MASPMDLIKGNVSTGIVIGVGAVLLAPVIAPVVAAAAKPLVKTLVKTGILAYEKGKETFAEAGEAFEDLVAEAASELSTERANGNGGAGKAVSRRPKAPAATV